MLSKSSFVPQKCPWCSHTGSCRTDVLARLPQYPNARIANGRNMQMLKAIVAMSAAGAAHTKYEVTMLDKHGILLSVTGCEHQARTGVRAGAKVGAFGGTFPQRNDMAAFIGRMLPQVHAQSQHAKVAHHVLSAYQRTFVRVMRAQLGPRATPGGLEVCPSTEVTSTEVTSMGLRRIIIRAGHDGN